jgi:hypothetical protein
MRSRLLPTVRRRTESSDKYLVRIPVHAVTRTLVQAAAIIVWLGGSPPPPAAAQDCGRWETLRGEVRCNSVILSVEISDEGRRSMVEAPVSLASWREPSAAQDFLVYTARITRVLKGDSVMGGVGGTTAVGHLRLAGLLRDSSGITTEVTYPTLSTGREYLLFGYFLKSAGILVFNSTGAFAITSSGLTPNWDLHNRHDDRLWKAAELIEGLTLAQAAETVATHLAEFEAEVAAAAARTSALSVVPSSDASMSVYRVLVTTQCGQTPSRRRPGTPVVRRELFSPANPFIDLEHVGASDAHVQRIRAYDAAAALPADAADHLGTDVIDAAEMARLGEGDFFRAFFTRFPSAPFLMSFSRVVFNDAISEALVSCTTAYGNLGGESYSVRLTRTPAGWVIAASRLGGVA